MWNQEVVSLWHGARSSLLISNRISSKKTPQNYLKCWSTFWIFSLTLKGAGRQTVDTRSTFGIPLKSLECNGSNELCGSFVASKLSEHQADEFVHRNDKKIAHFFCKLLCTQKFSGQEKKNSTGYFFGDSYLTSLGLILHRVLCATCFTTRFRILYSFKLAGVNRVNNDMALLAKVVPAFNLWNQV